MKWLAVGSLFFLLGLAGIIFAQRVLPMWVLAVAIFSLREIIIIPVEYMFVDFIAPPHLKGSYYGMQNLSSLGGAVNSLLTGLLLTYTPPVTIFGLLMLVTLLSLWFCYRGVHLAQRSAAGSRARRDPGRRSAAGHRLTIAAAHIRRAPSVTLMESQSAFSPTSRGCLHPR
ncbi:hypothetical protein [Sodalis glossinidius]|uniref:hypothetical protein n=1 Tax=Sodalis glossinidius TaxID=63612 RepID=UPI0002F89EA1|nr:hypothetical protein [Sodalis glossinidius]